MLSNHELDNTKIKHYTHGVRDFDSENMDMFAAVLNPEKMMEEFEQIFLNISRKMYQEPIVQTLYNQRKDYDLLVVNQGFNNVRGVNKISC